MSNDTDVRWMKIDYYYYPIYIIVIYVCMGIVGLVGNVVTCFVIISNKSMRTATNFYLLNLAIADLMILFLCCPIYSLFLENSDFDCKMRFLTVKAPIQVMIMTISLLSVERYVAICHPFVASKYKSSGRSRAVKAITIMWVLGLVCSLPESLLGSLVHNSKDPLMTNCDMINKIGLYLFGLRTSFLFFVPMMVIGVMYVLIGLRLIKSNEEIRSNNKLCSQRTKQKAPKMLMAIVGAFFMCWMPLYLYRVLLFYNQFKPITGVMKTVTIYFGHVSFLLYYSSSLINPIIYNMMSTKFREASKDTLMRCWRPRACISPA